MNIPNIDHLRAFFAILGQFLYLLPPDYGQFPILFYIRKAYFSLYLVALFALYLS